VKYKASTLSGWLPVANPSLLVGGDSLRVGEAAVNWALLWLFLIRWLVSFPVAVVGLFPERRNTTWRHIWPVFLILEWLGLLALLMFLENGSLVEAPDFTASSMII